MNLFIQHIYSWYSLNKRHLPWRETNDPYKIWLSEIILQQTRIAQGLKYYIRFIEEFPTIFDLAKAPEDQVLKLWQGLGYYSRARNMHFTAQYIVKNLNGVFPNDYKSVLALKGIGPYTAAAITSIAFDLPYPTIDGNIYRVISRYFGITTPIDSEKGKKEILKIANELMPQKNTGFHNQALMEFGALQCIPKSPDCKSCVLSRSCYAAKNKAQSKLPVKMKKTKQRIRYFYYYLIESNNSVFVEKREDNDIWKNLYQLPLLETKNELSDEELLKTEIHPIKNLQANLKSVSARKKHILSHQVIIARVLHFELKNSSLLSSRYIRANKKDIYKFAVPKLIEEFLYDFGILEN